ncbi:hypothetical protein C0989_007257 [Termitomyces sp. Mn162]|nr:hypothetical protein C0989_007257 [Termitomyces sp. Mn162]
MAKSSGLSAMDVLYSFSGFLVTQYLSKHFRRGDEVTMTSWFTQRASLSFNIFGNAIQLSLSLRDLTSRLIVYCRDYMVLLPVEKPIVSSSIELARAVLYAVIIRGTLPSILGTLMQTNILQRWMCDIAGLVALIIVLAPPLVFPSTSNVVSAIHLQEPAEVSLHEERTLIQTPSPVQKKKWVILVNRSPAPTWDRTPHRPLLPSPRSPSAGLLNNPEDRTRAVVSPTLSIDSGSMDDAGLSGTNSRVTRDSATPVNPPIMNEMDLFANSHRLISTDHVGSRSFGIAERLDMTVPEVINEPASEGFSLANDTFSLTDILSGESAGGLLDEQDLGMILMSVSGDGQSELLFTIPGEHMVTTCVPDPSLVPSKEPEELVAQVSALGAPSALAKSAEAFPLKDLEELTPRNNVSVAQQLEGVPLITDAIDHSYGANDTFSLTDLLASAGVKDDDNLLDIQEMRDDLANITLPESHEPTFTSPEKGKAPRTDKIFTIAEERSVPVARPSIHPDPLILDEFGPTSKKRGLKRQRESKDIDTTYMYTPYGPFPMAQMPYELFSPASMRASEVASALLSNEGRIRCADWRVDVDRGQQLLRVEQLAEKHDKDLAEFDKKQAALRNLMREHGLETSATPPRISHVIPNLQVTQASPDSDLEKPVLDRSRILLEAYRFPAFLEKAVPLTIDTSSGSKSSLVASESVDSMYDPDFPGLNGKQADKYPKLNSDWPADFPTEADTSDEWKLTQEMIDFWAARKARKEAENPPPPVNIDDLSMEVDDGGENDRSFADFEDSGEFNYEDEHCLPGNSKLKCVGWRYEVVPVAPQPPQEPRENLVETVGNAILNQMYSVYSMYGGEGQESSEEAPRSPSPPPLSPPEIVKQPLAPISQPAPAPSSTPSSITSKKSLAPRRQSTSKVAPTTRVLRPRPSAPTKTTLPEPLIARAPDPKLLSKLRPRASIATSTAGTSRAITEKKAAPRQSLPAPKTAPRPSLARPSAAPRASLAPSKTTRQSLAVPKAAPRQSLHIPAPAPKQTTATRRASIAVKATTQPQPKSKTSPPAPQTQTRPKTFAGVKRVSLTPTQASLPVSQTQIQRKTLTGVKRVPLSPIKTNVPRPCLSSTTTTTTATRTQKPISKVPPPKRSSLAPPPVQVVAGDAPKPSAPRPSLSRLPPRRTSIVSRR